MQFKYHVNLVWLETGEGPKYLNIESPVTPDEQEVIEKFRKLSEENKQLILKLLKRNDENDDFSGALAPL